MIRYDQESARKGLPDRVKEAGRGRAEEDQTARMTCAVFRLHRVSFLPCPEKPLPIHASKVSCFCFAHTLLWLVHHLLIFIHQSIFPLLSVWHFALFRVQCSKVNTELRDSTAGPGSGLGRFNTVDLFEGQVLRSGPLVSVAWLNLKQSIEGHWRHRMTGSRAACHKGKIKMDEEVQGCTKM